MLAARIAFQCVMAGLALVGLADCNSAVKRRFFATCGDSADCDSGLCSQGLCTKSCATSDECGAGVCIEKICKPIDRVQCTADPDCEKASPSNGCRTAVCAAGKCAFAAPLAGVVCGTKCEAGTWVPGQCTEGKCVAAKAPVPVTCDDKNVCTEDACTATTGCTYANRTAACDDGDACTVNDACAEGKCAPGNPLPCIDDHTCTDDSCDKEKGCVFSPTVGPCSDGDFCTDADKCVGGECQGGAPPQCNDNNPCTSDGCDKGKGCDNPPIDGPCDDGDGCTVGDACGGGSCKPGGSKPCADGNPCTDDGCDKAKGCINLANKANCDDGNACTAADVCGDSGCGGQAKSCDDGNACTADSCQISSGCVNLMTAAPCDDGDACTTGDTCNGDKCVPGQPLFCDNSKACLVPACDKVKGCTFAPKAGVCDDSEPCTVNDACAAGACVGAQDACDDGNPCTDNSCVKGSGCIHPVITAPCDDGNACTQGDICGGGNCVGTLTNCDDKIACTFDSCDNAKGGCQHNPDDVLCATNNPCDNGKCDVTKGCSSVVVPNGTACQKGDPCAVASQCQSGLCATTVPKKCDDGNPCTIDSCDLINGCTFDPTPSGKCDDGNPCTSGDVCQNGLCSAAGPAALCDDTNPCTDDNCDPAKGCTNTPSNAGCDDGDPCSSNDNCGSGKCTGTKALWKAKPNVASPYQAEGVAVSSGEIGLVGSSEVNADYVKRQVTVLDLGGTVKWQAPVNPSGIDRPAGIVGLNGLWYVCGGVKSTAAAVTQGFVRQHMANGSIGWDKPVSSGSNHVSLRGITVSGSTVCAIGKVGDGATAKTLVARFVEGGGALGNAEHAIDDSSEGFAVAGYPAGQGFAFGGRTSLGLDSKAVVGRLTEGGQIQWKLGLSESGAGFAEFHAVTLVGTDIVAAGELAFGGTPQVYVARVDGTGNKLWTKVVTPFNAGGSHSGGVAAYAGWLVVGVWGTLQGQDTGTVLLDAFGNEHSTAKVAVSGDQKLFGLAGVGDGTFVVHGTTTDTAQPVEGLLARVNAYFESNCSSGSQCAQVKGNVCDDGNPCTQDSCTPSNGCEFKAFGDGTQCSVGKTCSTGSCLP